MHPALHHGDLVVVERGHRASIGDIALVEEPGRSAVLHRVVVLTRTEVRTKGDANPIADLRAYRRSSVAGRVALVVPVGRWVERWR
jgi:phage repressor protein C with HTH and peptisase S24 domain